MKKYILILLCMTLVFTGCNEIDAKEESVIENDETDSVDNTQMDSEPIDTDIDDEETIDYLSMDRPMNLPDDIDHLYYEFLAGNITSTYTSEYDGVEYEYEVSNRLPVDWGISDDIVEYPMYRYCLLDVNKDGSDELIYDVSYFTSENLYILKNTDGILVTTLFEETHNSRMGFELYSNGILRCSGSWGGPEDYCTFYEFDNEAYPVESIHFYVDEKYEYDNGLNACYYNGDSSTAEEASYDDCVAIVDDFYANYELEWTNLFCE